MFCLVFEQSVILFGGDRGGGQSFCYIGGGRPPGYTTLHLKTVQMPRLCHRPRNCNLSNLRGLYKSLAPEIVSRFRIPLRGISCASGEKARCARLSPPADSRAFGINSCGIKKKKKRFSTFFSSKKSKFPKISARSLFTKKIQIRTLLRDFGGP